MFNYDYIFPIRNCCISADSLNRNNLRIESLPLDWIKPVTLEKAVDFISSEFLNFLDLKDLSVFSQDEKNIYCKNNENNLLFIHDFPLNKEICETFDDVKRKYNRRIQRLYQRMKMFKHILFLHIVEPNVCHEAEDDQYILRQFSRLQDLMPGKKISLLFIIIKKEVNDKPYIEHYITPQIRVCHCYQNKIIPENMKNILWGEFHANISQILACCHLATKTKRIIEHKRMSFSDKIKYTLYKIFKYPFVLFCCFIPNKTLRHTIRTSIKPKKARLDTD